MPDLVATTKLLGGRAVVTAVHSVNEIWPVYVITTEKFIKTATWKLVLSSFVFAKN